MRAVKAVLRVLIFFGSLFASAVLLTRVIPPAPIPQFSEKLAFFAAHKDDYDTLFLGSSRTFRQVLPAIFDPLMAAGGQPTRTFNFGLDGMFSPEDAYVAEKIFALRPRKLRRVFIEVSHFNTDFAAQPAETRRALHWHDWPRTRLLWRDIFMDGKTSRLTNPRRWARAWEHGRLFLIRAFNAGEGTRFLDPWRGIPPLPPQWVMGSAGDGAVPYAEETEYPGKDRALFESELAILRAGKAKIGKLAASPLESMRETIARVHALGAEPVLFISPMVVTRITSPVGQVSAPILDFSDPHRWPMLFDPAHRYDRGHLNSPGSRLYTRLFAEQVLVLPSPSH